MRYLISALLLIGTTVVAQAGVITLLNRDADDLNAGDYIFV